MARIEHNKAGNFYSAWNAWKSKHCIGVVSFWSAVTESLRLFWSSSPVYSETSVDAKNECVAVSLWRWEMGTHLATRQIEKKYYHKYKIKYILSSNDRLSENTNRPRLLWYNLE